MYIIIFIICSNFKIGIMYVLNYQNVNNLFKRVFTIPITFTIIIIVTISHIRIINYKLYQFIGIVVYTYL